MNEAEISTVKLITFITVHSFIRRQTLKSMLSTRIALTLSDPMSDLVRHYDFPVPDAFLDL
jgi:hypothetical protein